MNDHQKNQNCFFQKILALSLIILLLPILFVISLISLIDTRRNPFFLQERGLTLEKYRFKLIKFRTIKRSTSDLDNLNYPHILKKTFLYNDISIVGIFLRKTGFDELPQLFNILLGHMNFIGPRALSIYDLNRIKEEFPEFYKRRNQINSKPGIIGLWQVNKDIECSISHLIESDENYEKNKSFSLNLKILIKAIEIILFGYHIDSIINGKNLKVYPIVIYATLISVISLLIIIIQIISL